MKNTNPYDPQTPEWQLHANMESAQLEACAFARDAERYQHKAEDARRKFERYKAALSKLTGLPS